MTGIRSGGLELVASSRPIQDPKFEVNEECSHQSKSLFRRRYRCGHVARRAFTVTIFGRRRRGTIHQKELCPECLIEDLKKQAIRCVRCGSTIMPGDPVSLYHHSSPGLHVEVATKVDDQTIGCLGWDCCPSGAFFAGHWTEDGFKGAF
jgi:hypothetical protein